MSSRFVWMPEAFLNELPDLMFQSLRTTAQMLSIECDAVEEHAKFDHASDNPHSATITFIEKAESLKKLLAESIEELDESIQFANGLLRERTFTPLKSVTPPDPLEVAEGVSDVL